MCDIAEAVSRGKSFAYRGIDLSHAFKRGVYFALINSAAAYDVFRSEQRGTVPALPVGEPSRVQEVLSEYLSPSGLPRKPRSLRRRLHDSARWLRDLARLERSASPGRLATPSKRSGALWALAIQPKFVAHLQPVLEALDEPYRIVTFDDPATDDHVRSLGNLSLNAGAGGATTPLGYLSGDFDVVRTYAIAYDAVFRLLKQDMPRCILLSEGNAPVYEVVNLAARRLGIPTVCVQQGWSPIVHTGFRDLSFSSMVVWGEWFAEALAPHNPGQRFAALGHHLIDLHQPKTSVPRTVGFFLQRGSRLISDDAWAGMLDLIEFCARDLRAQVLVREHPNGPLTDAECRRLGALPAVELLPPGQASLQSVLTRCDVVVSVFSTTILEGIGMGALPIVINVASLPSYYPDVAADGAGIEVKDFAAARDALRMLWSEGTTRYAPRIAAMQRRLFAHGGSEALERIVSHVRSEFGLVPGDAAQR